MVAVKSIYDFKMLFRVRDLYKVGREATVYYTINHGEANRLIDADQSLLFSIFVPLDRLFV